MRDFPFYCKIICKLSTSGDTNSYVKMSSLFQYKTSHQAMYVPDRTYVRSKKARKLIRRAIPQDMSNKRNY